MVKAILYEKEFDKVLLGRREGEVHPWNGYDIPSELEKPLAIDPFADGIIGIPSGDRSAIITCDDVLYKLKGCNPILSMGMHHTGEPWGSMSYEKCTTELKNSDKISKMYLELIGDAPLIPVGRYEYSDVRNNKKDNCGIFRIKGDTRLGRCVGRLLNNPPNANNLYFKKLLMGVSRWLGFDQHILEKAGMAVTERSLDVNNYVVWKFGDGYGVSRIDLTSSIKSRKSAFKKKIEFDISTLKGYGESYSAYDVAIKLGIKPEFLIKTYEKDTAILLCYVNSEEEEKITSLNKSVEVPMKFLDKDVILTATQTALISSTRLKWVKELEREYKKSYEGGIIPDPIDPVLFEVIFDRTLEPKLTS